jgi:sterol desaturase/sphingolipid hydroxylase (fatty acid hydroxylase superfamily)
MSWIDPIFDYIARNMHVGYITSRIDGELVFLLYSVPIFLFEIYWVGWRKSTLGLAINLKRTHCWDLVFFVLTFFNLRKALSHLFTLTALLPVMYWAHQTKYPLLSDSWPLAVRVAAAYIAYEFLAYWYHRICHESAWLWNAHSFHHSSTEVTMVTPYRVHPLDLFVSFPITSVPLIIFLNQNFYGVVAFSVAMNLVGFVAHSRIDTDYGWLGKIFVSPRFHHLHHSMHETEMNKNYGHSLVIFDLMFGTYAPPVKSIYDIEAGIKDNIFENEPPLKALLLPVKNFYQMPTRWILGWFRTGSAVPVKASNSAPAHSIRRRNNQS